MTKAPSNLELPRAVEAEMSLLGAVLLDPNRIPDVLDALGAPGDNPASAFYTERHAAIFDAILAAYNTSGITSGGAAGGVDLVIVAQILTDRGLIESVGGHQYLVALAEQSPGSVNAEHYARIVASKALLRRIHEAGEQIAHHALHSGDFSSDAAEAAKEIADEAQRLVMEATAESSRDGPVRLAELLHATMERLEESEGKPCTGLATGFYDLDALTAGLQPGDMAVIAARPSMGKTTLALNLAEQIALHGVITSAGEATSGGSVLFFSMEMSKQAIAERILSAKSGVDAHLLRTNKIGEQHYQKLIRACGELGEAPILVDDTPGLSILQLRARARNACRRHKVACVFVDYLQLMTAPGAARESRQVEVSAISRGVKALARELNVPVVCLSQLNRAAEQREGHRPRMSDLRESGSIEQDADVVMLLHREDYYHVGEEDWARANPEKVGVAELIVAKQRNGPTGTVTLTWNSRITRFQNHQRGLAA